MCHVVTSVMIVLLIKLRLSLTAGMRRPRRLRITAGSISGHLRDLIRMMETGGYYIHLQLEDKHPSLIIKSSAVG